MQLKKWAKRLAFFALFLALLFVVVGFSYEQFQRHKASKITPPGDFADIGTHKLHYLKQGEGGPTVVFESGFDMGGHLPWYKVQSEVSNHTTTLSYDREGVMWSEESGQPRSCEQMAKDLAALLTSINAPKPYILVGHSLAGLPLKSFVSLFPEDVAGVVFVDASHSEQMKRIPQDIQDKMQLPPTVVLNVMNHLGILRFLYADQAYASTKPEEPINQHKAAMIHKLSGVHAELAAIDALFEDSSRVTTFGDTPLVVLSAKDPQRYSAVLGEDMGLRLAKVWDDMQVDLLDLSSQSSHVMDEQSGHYLQLENPELVWNAILNLLRETSNTVD